MIWGVSMFFDGSVFPHSDGSGKRYSAGERPCI